MDLIFIEIQNKNTKIFKQFFNKHYKELVTYAHGYLFDQHVSEDIVQEVFIQLWEKSEELNIKTSLLAYLYAMVRNRCINYLKTLKITDDYSVLEFNISLATEHDLESFSEDEKQIVYRQILKIVESLPEKMQEIVKLKFISGYKYSEIASEMNISVNTVKTQLKRAKIQISKLITAVLLLLENAQ